MCLRRSLRGSVCIVLFCAGLLLPNGRLLAREDDKSQQQEKDVYEPGGDVRPPKLVHYVEPEFEGDSKEAFVEGTVKISTVITLEGEPVECRVVGSLTSGQDKRAMDAVKQWRFQAGTKSGKPVKVRVTVEVGFRLL